MKDRGVMVGETVKTKINVGNSYFFCYILRRFHESWKTFVADYAMLINEFSWVLINIIIVNHHIKWRVEVIVQSKH